MKVAIVGTGAAAYGAVLALAEIPGITLELIGPDRESHMRSLAERDPRQWAAEEYDQLHRAIRDVVGLKFPPPRTLLGETVSRFPLVAGSGKGALWRGERFGGLANYWSGSMFPLAPRDLEPWGMGGEVLAPHYRRIADAVGIAGVADAMEAHYGETYVNRPPAPCSALNQRMIDAVNGHGRQNGQTLFAGTNRLAIETRPGHAMSCVGCGECFYGCFRESLFRPAIPLRRWMAEGRLGWRQATVARLAPAGQGWRLWLDDGECADYDRVLLCAGATGSSEILLRSFGSPGDSVMVEDNELYMFALVQTGWSGEKPGDYMSIANSVIGIQPDSPAMAYTQAHVTPFPDYLVNYYLPKGVADRLDWGRRLLKGRVLLGKLYVDGATAAQYSLGLGRDNVIERHVVTRGRSDEHARQSLKGIARAVASAGFVMPPMPLMRAATSSHYVGGFAGGALGLRPDGLGQVAPGLHIADSAAFPRTPAQPLTFTIMANAHRIATALTA